MKNKYDINNYYPSIKKHKVIIQVEWEDGSKEEQDITNLPCKEIEWYIDGMWSDRMHESEFYKTHPCYTEFNALLNDDSDFAVQYNDKLSDFEDWLLSQDLKLKGV